MEPRGCGQPGFPQLFLFCRQVHLKFAGNRNRVCLLVDAACVYEPLEGGRLLVLEGEGMLLVYQRYDHGIGARDALILVVCCCSARVASQHTGQQ